MKKIIINSEPWQVRAAVLEDKKLVEVQFQDAGEDELERSFFKGKIKRILPGIQTAFVDIGYSKAGFLHITEVDRSSAYKRLLIEGQDDEEPEDVSGGAYSNYNNLRAVPDISKIYTEGQEILVQVIKEPIGTKGAKLSTCFTIPGKFCVLMANIPHIGVSRKIENKEERTRLKEIVKKYLEPDMGVVIRTTAEGRSESEICRDLDYLISTWHDILLRFSSAQVGEKIYQDLPLHLRVIRENLDEATSQVVCDDKNNYHSTKNFLKRFMPDQEKKVRLYRGKTPIFFFFCIEKQIEELLDRKVNLKSGGSLIIEATEAMTVIDVNTGRFVGSNKLEDTVFKTNMEAVDEIVRQLRLRNIGGIIVIDFIDMSKVSNRNKLYRQLEKVLKEKDKLRSVALRVSEFGIVQMTRKRTGKTLAQRMTEACGNCNARGMVKSAKTLAFQVLRGIKGRLVDCNAGKVEVLVSEGVFDYLSSDMQASLIELEKQLGIKLVLGLSAEHSKAQFTIKKCGVK